AAWAARTWVRGGPPRRGKQGAAPPAPHPMGACTLTIRAPPACGARGRRLSQPVLRHPTTSLRLLGAIDEVPAAAWDALLGPDSTPFMAHAWLHALEAS